jgi:DNA repair protein RadD
MAANTVASGQRVLLLSHRRELVKQLSAKLFAVGVDHGILQAGFPTRLNERVQVASIQTLHARVFRTRTIELPAADLVVVDEGHHAPAKSYSRLIAQYPEAVIAGFTATPCRADGRGLGRAFDMLIEIASTPELIALGWLVPTKVFAPAVPDLKGVQVRRGDYVGDQLAARMNTPQLVGDVVENWFKFGERRPTVVFAVNVGHSIHLRDQFRQSGVLAEHIDGSTPTQERDRILAQLADGKVEVVTNCLDRGLGLP